MCVIDDVEGDNVDEGAINQTEYVYNRKIMNALARGSPLQERSFSFRHNIFLGCFVFLFYKTSVIIIVYNVT